MKIMRIVGFLFLFIQLVSAQVIHPTDYFSSPLDIPLSVTGNFGELRSNHFHAGLDFRTKQVEGLSVYAAAEGFVSRIKISSFGYGKAIYIAHPNGYTTVYGHLLQANPIIDNYIREQHYKQKEFEIDVYLKPINLPIKKGEVIALSGNSGGSGGPHLHFEIRDSKTEKTINPLFFGFDKLIPDTKIPQIDALIAYPLSDDGSINQTQRPFIASLTKISNGHYISEKIKANGIIGFAINAYDMMDFSYSKNGLFKVEAFVNGAKTFAYKFDTFSFDESKHINALIDYQRLITTGVRFQKLFRFTPFDLSIIESDRNQGILKVTPNLNLNYNIELSDFNNNKVVITVPIVFSYSKPQTLNDAKKTKILLKSKIENIYNKDNITVNVPPNTFYDDFYLNFEVSNDTLTFANQDIAVQNSFQIIFEKNIPQQDQSKTFIASLNGKKLLYNKTYFKEGRFSTYTKKLGKFILARDEVAPTVIEQKFIKSRKNKERTTLEFTINDALSGIATYVGTINAQWALFDYDFKTKKLKHRIADGIVQEGSNFVKLFVKDNVGNVTNYETNFTYTKN